VKLLFRGGVSGVLVFILLQSLKKAMRFVVPVLSCGAVGVCLD